MIKIIAIGKIKDSNLQSLVDDYILRISRFDKIEMIEVADLGEGNNDTENQNIIEEEGLKALSKIKDKDYVVLLDLHGQQIDSIQLADKINTITTYESSTISFVIGGSLGVSKQLRARANFRWQLSKLTFTHLITRLLILEQIFRAFKILKNQNYHK
jgi:23S rRNA (pseudouridine1915-N3)-methyltransferase